MVTSLKSRAPVVFDESSLLSCLEQLQHELGIELPALSLFRGNESLRKLAPAERHKAEEKWIDRTLKSRLGLPESAETPFDADWLPSGKPIFRATPDAGMHLSLTHDEAFSLCVIGESPQGCDLMALGSLDGPARARVLEMQKKEPSLKGMLSGDSSEEIISARLHCAHQAAEKAIGSAPLRVSVEARRGPAVLFKVEGGASRSSAWVVTLPIRLGEMPERMLAIVVDRAMVMRKAA